MSKGKLYDAIVYWENGTQLKKCRICRVDLATAEVIRAWESNGKINTILACPNCGRFMLAWRKKPYARNKVSDRVVG